MALIPDTAEQGRGVTVTSNAPPPPQADDELSDKQAGIYAVSVTIIVVAILFSTKLFISSDLFEGDPNISITAATVGQVGLINEVNRQLSVWPKVARHLADTSYFLGAISAAFTVIIGFMKNRTNVKMLLMAISASISFLMGAMQPGEQSNRYLNAFRSLYSGAMTVQASTAISETDIKALAKALTEAEQSLTNGKR